MSVTRFSVDHPVAVVAVTIVVIVIGAMAALDLAIVSAILGLAQIGTAAPTIPLVDVFVFLPIGFASRVVGLVLREFGVVVGFATLVSLLVSFTLTPLLASRWSLRKGDAPERALLSFAGHGGFVSNWYERRALPWALAHPIAVIVTCCVLLFAAFALVVLGVVGGEVLPRSQTGSMTARDADRNNRSRQWAYEPGRGPTIALRTAVAFNPVEIVIRENQYAQEYQRVDHEHDAIATGRMGNAG
jgi:multidrug efflux pump subunit AcrB